MPARFGLMEPEKLIADPARGVVELTDIDTLFTVFDGFPVGVGAGACVAAPGSPLLPPAHTKPVTYPDLKPSAERIVPEDFSTVSPEVVTTRNVFAEPDGLIAETATDATPPTPNAAAIVACEISFDHVLSGFSSTRLQWSSMFPVYGVDPPHTSPLEFVTPPVDAV